MNFPRPRRGKFTKAFFAGEDANGGRMKTAGE